MDDFRYLSRRDVEHELLELMGKLEPQEDDRESFAAWAWFVARASDTFASQNRSGCAALLHDEAEAMDRVISRRVRRLGVSQELACKREFLTYLEHQVEGVHSMAVVG